MNHVPVPGTNKVDAISETTSKQASKQNLIELSIGESLTNAKQRNKQK